jgi:hypothetical protein
MSGKSMKITKDNFSEYKKALHDFLVSEIERYAEKAGGCNQLSYTLKKSKPYVVTVLKRDNMLALEDLYLMCKKYFKE